VLRAMQHDPEDMFRVLERRADATAAAALARAFGAMPYLAFDADSSAVSAGECSGMSSDSEGSTAGAQRKTRASGGSPREGSPCREKQSCQSVSRRRW
jgi:hypothetical protein